MVIKQIVLLIASVCFSTMLYSQETIPYPLENSVGTVRLNIETSLINYRQKDASNYTKMGFGLGADIILFNQNKSFISLSPSFLFNGTEEERKTYSVENSNYYYRSTTLTGRILGATALNYSRQINSQIAIGLGFQPQFVLRKFQNQYRYGESAITIPDVEFRKTESTILFSMIYQIDYTWNIKLIGQMGVSPVTQDDNSPYSNAVRFQLSRKIVN